MALAGSASVDFTIRAKDLTTKPTQDIVSALEDLQKAQKAITVTNGELSASSEQLQAEQKALVTVLNELDKRLQKVSQYDANKQKLQELTAATSKAKDQQVALAAALDQAKASGDKAAKTSAASNLKDANSTLSTLIRQTTQLQNAQDKLSATIKARAGIDINDPTQRGSLNQARSQVGSALDTNTVLQQYKAEQAEEQRVNAQTEAAKRQQLAETAAFQKQLDAAQDLTRRNDYQVAYTRLLEQQDEELAKQRTNEAALTAEANERALAEQRAADQLDRYRQIGERAKTTLAAGQASRATPSATAQAGPSIAASVKATLDPLSAQTSTLSGIEGALTEVEAAITKAGSASLAAKDKIKALSEAEEKLDAVQKGLTANAKLVDQLSRQNAVTEQARQNLAAAEQAVASFANQISTATVVDDKLVASLSQAQNKLQGAAGTFNAQSAALNNLKTSAAAAGVNVDNLATEEARLNDSAVRTANGQRQVADSMDAANKGAGGLAGAFEKLGSGGRTTLSLSQRIRGEILSLTATFVGAQAAVGALGSVLDAVKTDQSVRAQIAQTTNSPEEAAKQYQFLQSEAQRTSFSFESLAKSYALVVRQAKEYGLSQNAINTLFSDVITNARSMGQTTEQLEGTFTALGQIFDKTTIQSEEFKKQLSNQGLAGLFPTLAKIMQDQGVKSVADVQKAMENAQVPAAEITKVFAALAASGDKAFGANMRGYAAELGRFQNQLYNVKLQFADSGFLKGVSDGLDRVSAALARPETQQALRDLGAAIGDLIAKFADFATNSDNLKSALSLLEAYLVTKFIVSLISTSAQMTTLGAKMVEMGGFAATAGKAIGFGGKVGLVGAVIALGIALGDVLQKIPVVSKALDDLQNSSLKDDFRNGNVLALFNKAVGGVAQGAAALIDDTPETVADDVAKQKAFDQQRKTRAAIVANGGTLATPKTPTADVDKDAATAESDAKIASDREENLQKTIDKIHRNAEIKDLKSRKDYLAAVTEQQQAAVDQAQQIVDAAQKSGDAKRIASAKTAQTNLNNALQFAADQQYSAQARALAKTQQSQIEEYQKRRQSLDEATNAVILASRQKLDELIAKNSNASLEVQKQQAEAAVQDQIDKQKLALTKAINDNNDAITKGTKLGQDTSSLQADNARLESAIKLLDTQSSIAKSLADQKVETDNLALGTDKINEKIKLREALLSSIAALQKAGNITPQDASKQAKKVDTDTLDGPGGINDSINKQIDANTAFIESQVAAGTATDGMVAKITLENAALVEQQATINASRSTTDKFSQDLNNIVANGATSGFGQAAAELGKLVDGTEKWGEAWHNVGDIVRNTIADILVGIAKYIIQQQILNALKKEEAASSQGGGGGGFLNALISVVGGGSKHTGGTISGRENSRPVNPAWFTRAPHFHNGGMVPGLGPGEVPIVAREGEEVLTSNDPRHSKNTGNNDTSANSEVGKPGGDTHLHVYADHGSFLEAGLSTRSGDKAMFAYIQANRTKISKLLNS